VLGSGKISEKIKIDKELKEKLKAPNHIK